MKTRRESGRAAQTFGISAEEQAVAALQDEGWTVLARRLRTQAGEIDLVAERDGLVAFIEVKARPSLAEAAFSLSSRQQGRLLAAAQIVLSLHPDWGCGGIRFDLLIVDRQGRVRRIADAFRTQADP